MCCALLCCAARHASSCTTGLQLDLKGLSAYDAAVFCAAMTAAERQRLLNKPASAGKAPAAPAADAADGSTALAGARSGPATVPAPPSTAAQRTASAVPPVADDTRSDGGASTSSGSTGASSLFTRCMSAPDGRRLGSVVRMPWHRDGGGPSREAASTSASAPLYVLPAPQQQERRTRSADGSEGGGSSSSIFLPHRAGRRSADTHLDAHHPASNAYPAPAQHSHLRDGACLDLPVLPGSSSAAPAVVFGASGLAQRTARLPPISPAYEGAAGAPESASRRHSGSSSSSGGSSGSSSSSEVSYVATSLDEGRPHAVPFGAAHHPRQGALLSWARGMLCLGQRPQLAA